MVNYDMWRVIIRYLKYPIIPMLNKSELEMNFRASPAIILVSFTQNVKTEAAYGVLILTSHMDSLNKGIDCKPIT